MRDKKKFYYISVLQIKTDCHPPTISSWMTSIRVVYVCPSSTFSCFSTLDGQGWKKPPGDQAMTWHRDMKNSTSNLASVVRRSWRVWLRIEFGETDTGWPVCGTCVPYKHEKQNRNRRNKCCVLVFCYFLFCIRFLVKCHLYFCVDAVLIFKPV